MTSGGSVENEIKSWLEVLLKSEALKKISVKIEGNSEKGDGYMGDILFVEVNGVSEDGIKKNYNIVLKCAKRSAALREKSPVKDAFLNEIFFYGTVHPRFRQFQEEKHVDDPFNKVPKCYGTLVKGEMEVLALENLKKKGYVLWERTKPLTRKHIDMVITEYGKYHAVSIAMKQQRPKEFEKLTKKPVDVSAKFVEMTDMVTAFQGTIHEIYNLLKNDLDENILTKWQNLKNDVEDTFTSKLGSNAMKVMTHGDCWNNNFMHYHGADGQPITFAMLDWQLIRYSSPIYDLSYFLFACLSKEDMDDLDSILKLYHQTLVDHSKKLGTDNVEELYPFKQFLNEWKRLCRYGIIMSTMIHKFSLTEKEDIPDMAAAAERGEDIAAAFTRPTKNVADYKKRMKYIVRYVTQHICE